MVRQIRVAKIVGVEVYRLSGTSRREVGIIAQDRRSFHSFVERLCSLAGAKVNSFKFRVSYTKHTKKRH